MSQFSWNSEWYWKSQFCDKTEKVSVTPLFLTTVLFSSSISLSLSLPKSLCPLFPLFQVETHKRTGTAMRSGKWRPYGCHELFHCPPPTAFVGGPWEPDKQWEWLERQGGVRRRTGNREQETMSSRREKRSEHAETERRLWSSCRNCGMKTWKHAMQLKVRANRKFGLCHWKAFNNNNQKHTHIMTSLPTQLVIAFRYGHLPTYSVSTLWSIHLPLWV